ncbi:MAG TPA: GNAT family N-acetyltransferase [Tepidisphaeraceae bacterium]|nr:GNAT family N-acetyltransferase [Tepidisphaeraceae bacterium]
MSFAFLQIPALVDRELELVPPDARWVDALLATCAHPKSATDPSATTINRARVLDFLRAAPGGLQPPDSDRRWVPSYHFWMRLHPISGVEPPVQIAGGINLRVGDNEDLHMYAGHIGYNVYPPARGRHYAERACRLLFTVARMHRMKRIWITCNPDNWPSRRTCERLGGTLVGIVPVPPEHPLYLRGEHEKCRYWIDL